MGYAGIHRLVTGEFNEQCSASSVFRRGRGANVPPFPHGDRRQDHGLRGSRGRRRITGGRRRAERGVVPGLAERVLVHPRRPGCRGRRQPGVRLRADPSALGQREPANRPRAETSDHRAAHPRGRAVAAERRRLCSARRPHRLRTWPRRGSRQGRERVCRPDDAGRGTVHGGETRRGEPVASRAPLGGVQGGHRRVGEHRGGQEERRCRSQRTGSERCLLEPGDRHRVHRRRAVAGAVPGPTRGQRRGGRSEAHRRRCRCRREGRSVPAYGGDLWRRDRSGRSGVGLGSGPDRRVDRRGA